MPYLTADEVRATVAQIAELSAPAGQLVVNYQTKSRQRPSCGSRCLSCCACPDSMTR